MFKIRLSKKILIIFFTIFVFVNLINLTKNDLQVTQKHDKCTLQTCFNFSKCNSKDFKIHVYREPKIIRSSISEEILNATLESPYYTSNPNEACLYLLQIDTLDRDPSSKAYIQNLNIIIENLSSWNNGENLILFNHYSGTWPSYIVDNWNFNTQKAIRIQSSLSQKDFQNYFDISFFGIFMKILNKKIKNIYLHLKVRDIYVVPALKYVMHFISYIIIEILLF
jgi:energy-converting hydrogenase Eha subunit H